MHRIGLGEGSYNLCRTRISLLPLVSQRSSQYSSVHCKIRLLSSCMYICGGACHNGGHTSCSSHTTKFRPTICQQVTRSCVRENGHQIYNLPHNTTSSQAVHIVVPSHPKKVYTSSAACCHNHHFCGIHLANTLEGKNTEFHFEK